jgi:hypothetical protein
MLCVFLDHFVEQLSPLGIKVDGFRTVAIVALHVFVLILPFHLWVLPAVRREFSLAERRQVRRWGLEGHPRKGQNLLK